MDEHYIKNKLKGMSREEKSLMLQQLILKQHVKDWRKWGLKACRDRAAGKEIEPSPK